MHQYRVVESYFRQQHFDFFRPYPNPFYSITFELDATALKAFVKEKGYPVYLNLCYFLTKAMQEVEDFRYRLLDDQIVLYKTLHLGITVPSADGLFSFAHYDFHPKVDIFNQRAASHADEGRGEATLETKKHTNYTYCTAIPGVTFTSFVHATPEDTTDGAARIAFGQFTERQGRLIVPVGMTVNHIFIDGGALGALAQGAQRIFSAPE